MFLFFQVNEKSILKRNSYAMSSNEVIIAKYLLIQNIFLYMITVHLIFQFQMQSIFKNYTHTCKEKTATVFNMGS